METDRKTEVLKRYHQTQAKLRRHLTESNGGKGPQSDNDIIDHCRFNIPFFMHHFLGHHIPLGFSDFHRIIIQEYREEQHSTLRGGPIHERPGNKVAIAAPRENAKTTIRSLALPIHAICYGLENYIVVFSATQPQATQLVRNIRDEFDENDEIKAFYSLAWGSKGEQAFTVNGVRIEGHGITTARRGIKWRENRPSLIILDDMEEDESVLSADQRKKTRNRFNRVIEFLGSPHTNTWVVGTTLHQEALLPYMLKRPDYKAYTFKAIESEPVNTDLWNQWEKIYFDLDNRKRQADSDAFYEANRKKMDEGAKVLWPERETLKDLQAMRATKGAYAFNAEKMSDPNDPETQVFFPDEYERFEMSAGTVKRKGCAPVRSADMIVFHFLDPALGLKEEAKAKRGARDFASVATIGIDNVGKIYVLDVWLAKALPEVQVCAALDRWEMFGGEIGFESTAFQAVMRIPFEAEILRRGLKNVSVSDMGQHANKTARIMRLEPMFKHGWIILNRDLPVEFWNQFRSFPTASHDDGPDALEGAISFAQARGALKFAG